MIYEKSGMKNAEEHIVKRDNKIELTKIIMKRFEKNIEEIGIKDAVQSMSILMADESKPNFNYDKINSIKN